MMKDTLSRFQKGFCLSKHCFFNILISCVSVQRMFACEGCLMKKAVKRPS